MLKKLRPQTITISQASAPAAEASRRRRDDDLHWRTLCEVLAATNNSEKIAK